MISVRRIKVGEGELYKQIRLRALREAPYAFLSTYASALERSAENWREQADRSAEGKDRATFFAFSEDELVGLAALYRDPDRADTGEILQVWIAPEQRGTGLAVTLLDEVLDWGRQNGFNRFLANVTQKNDHALRFYLRYGFRLFRAASPEIPENLLVKDIHDPTQP
jgi:GNAT superfamily N-acetyltransferase